MGLGGLQEVQLTKLGDGIDLGKVEGRDMSKMTSRYLARVAGWAVGLLLCKRALKDLKVWRQSGSGGWGLVS